MKVNKIIGLIAAVSLITSGTVFAYSEVNSGDAELQIEEYKPAPQKQEVPGFKITPYENIYSMGWINDREILIRIKNHEYPKTIKGINTEDMTPYTYVERSYYLAVYNPDTGSTKEFRDVNMADYYYSFSPDKKYALYEDYKIIPEVGGKEWKAALENGELYNHKMMLLNLSTGAITGLNTKYKNKDAEYQWIDNDRIIANYPFEGSWDILDLNGNVLKTGPVTDMAEEFMSLCGTDIKAVGNELSGVVYFKIDKTVKKGDKLGTVSDIVTVDINTKEQKSIKKIDAYVLFARSNGVNLLKEYSSTFGLPAKLQWLDETDTLKKEYLIDHNVTLGPGTFTQSSVSPDGKMIALATHKNESVQIRKADGAMDQKGVWAADLTLLDLNTGSTKEVLNCGSIENISWNKDGNTICFSSRTNLDAEPTTYIVSLN